MPVRPVNPEVQGRHLRMEVQVWPVNPEVQGRHLPLGGQIETGGLVEVMLSGRGRRMQGWRLDSAVQ